MTMSNNASGPTRGAFAKRDVESVQKSQRAIGRQLRGLFDDIVAEGVPDEFDALLDRLRDREDDGSDPASRRGRAAVGRGAGEVRVLADGSGEAR